MLLAISGRASRRGKDRHHLHVPAAALSADEMPVLGHGNEDHVVQSFNSSNVFTA